MDKEKGGYTRKKGRTSLRLRNIEQKGERSMTDIGKGPAQSPEGERT